MWPTPSIYSLDCKKFQGFLAMPLKNHRRVTGGIDTRRSATIFAPDFATPRRLHDCFSDSPARTAMSTIKFAARFPRPFTRTCVRPARQFFADGMCRARKCAPMFPLAAWPHGFKNRGNIFVFFYSRATPTRLRSRRDLSFDGMHFVSEATSS